MQNETDALKDDDENDPAFFPCLRFLSDMGSLWGLCRNPACGRARRCKRDPRFCLRRYGALLPPDVHAGSQRLYRGWIRGKGFDDVYDEAPDEIAAVEEWNKRMQARLR